MKMKIGTIRALSVASFGALLAYVFLIEPYWVEVTHHVGAARHQTQRVRIAQLSDLHLHNFGRREQRVVDALSRWQPDLLLLTGDVIDRADALAALPAFLKATGDVPKLAVLGNWEHWAKVDIAELRDIYQQQGTRLLINQSTRLTLQGRIVDVVGLDDYTAGVPATTPSPQPASDAAIVLLLQHSPGMFDDETFANMLKLRLDLCLAGHTHGGQLTLFGLPLWKPPGSGGFNAGNYPTTYCPLYVSRGIGTSVLPARFGARPEIAVFDL